MIVSENVIELYKALETEERVKVAKFVIEENRKGFVLSSRPDEVTVGNLESWLMQPDLQENKENIIKFIEHRLNNRYLVAL